MKSHWSKKTTNREMISLKQEDEGKRSRAKVKAFQKPCLDVAFLSFFVRARAAASIKIVSLKIFFWVGDMTLVLLETTFNPTLNTQFMAGNYIRVIGCLSPLF